MNKKGQALIEFVLVLPILIFILLFIVDISKIMIMKNHLETVLNSVSIDDLEVYDNEYDIKLIKNINGNKVEIKLESCINVITPGLNKILGDPACTNTSKVIERE